MVVACNWSLPCYPELASSSHSLAVVAVVMLEEVVIEAEGRLTHAEGLDDGGVVNSQAALSTVVAAC